MISLHSGRDAEMISCIAWIAKRKQWLRCDFMQCYSDISGLFIFHVECDRLEEITTKSEWIKEKEENKNRKGHGKPHFNRSGIPPKSPSLFIQQSFSLPFHPHIGTACIYEKKIGLCVHVLLAYEGMIGLTESTVIFLMLHIRLFVYYTTLNTAYLSLPSAEGAWYISIITYWLLADIRDRDTVYWIFQLCMLQFFICTFRSPLHHLYRTVISTFKTLIIY